MGSTWNLHHIKDSSDKTSLNTARKGWSLKGDDMNQDECDRLVIKWLVDKVQKRGKLKPAQQRHNQKQAKTWQTKVARRGVK